MSKFLCKRTCICEFELQLAQCQLKLQLGKKH